MKENQQQESLYHQLSSKVNAAIADYYKNDCILNLTSVENILTENKNKSYFYDDLRFFYNNFYPECLPLVAGSKLAEEVRVFFKKIDQLIKDHEKKQHVVKEKTVSSWVEYFSKASNAIKNSLKIIAGAVLVNPVAGRPSIIKLSSPSYFTIDDTGTEISNQNSTSYLQKIIEGDHHSWDQFYNDKNITLIINKIIKEVEKKIDSGDFSYEIKAKIFSFFRKNHLQKKISTEQNQKIFQIVKSTLTQPDNELFLLEENQLKIFLDILAIANAVYPDYKQNKYVNNSNNENDIEIFSLLLKTATNNILLNRQKEASQFTNELFDAYKTYFPGSINSISKLENLTQPMRDFIESQLVWNINDPVALLYKALDLLKTIIKCSQENVQVIDFIDKYAKKMSEKAIREIPNYYELPYPKDFVKEDIWAAYVRYSQPRVNELFAGIYKEVTYKTVFPHSESQYLKGVNGASDLYVKINYDELSLTKKKKAFALVEEAYQAIERLKSDLQLKSVNHKPINMTINLYNDKFHFNRYEYLLIGDDSNGGGICTYEYGKNLCIPNIYQTLEGFVNFKHETVHALAMHLLGKNYSYFVSGAFIEGIAEWYDKGAESSYKMNLLANIDKNEIKSLSEIVNLNEGGRNVYLYGYFWFKYMFENKHLNTLANIFTKIQQEDKKEITRLTNEYAEQEAANFNQQMIKLKEQYKAFPINGNELYLKHLIENPDFVALIEQKEGQIQFDFYNKRFILTAQEISYIHIKRDDKGNIQESSKKLIDSSEYESLQENLLTTIFSKVIYSDIFVLDEFQHSVLFTNLKPDELYSKGIINFIYNVNKLNIRHKLFVKEKKATLNFTTSTTNWIRQTIDDKTIDPFVVLAQKKYSLDLEKNPELKNSIERNGGQIRFEFERIGFNLGAEKISSYSIDRGKEWSISEIRPDEINYLDYAILKDNLKKNMNHKSPLHPNDLLFNISVQKSEFYNEGIAKFAEFDIENPEFKKFLNQKKSTTIPVEYEVINNISIENDKNTKLLNQQSNERSDLDDLQNSEQNDLPNISLSALENQVDSKSYLLERYQQDLKASSSLQAFIEKNDGEVRFDFNDIAFILKNEEISALSLFRNKKDKIEKETVKELNEADYGWFLDSLAIEVIKIEQQRKLKKATKEGKQLKVKPINIIKKLFQTDKQDIRNRRLKSQNVKRNFKFNNAIRAFVVNAEYKGRLFYLLQPYIDKGCSMNVALDKVIEKALSRHLKLNSFIHKVRNSARLVDPPLSVDAEVIAPRVQTLSFEQESSSTSSLNTPTAIGGAVAGGILLGSVFFAAKKRSNLSRSSAQTRKETQSLVVLA